MSDSPPDPSSRFQDISTHSSVLAEPRALLQRYGRAITGYLTSLVGPEDADDAVNEFAIQILKGGFTRWEGSTRGLFRNYLQRSVRNHASTFKHRGRRRAESLPDGDLFTDPRRQASGDARWLSEWRNALLQAALKDLKDYQEGRGGENVYYTLVLLLIAEADGHAKTSAGELAALLSRETGRPYTEDNARQQALRARRKFAELLVLEVARTLEEVTPGQVEDELKTLGLHAHVADHLSLDREALDRLLARA